MMSKPLPPVQSDCLKTRDFEYKSRVFWCSLSYAMSPQGRYWMLSISCRENPWHPSDVAELPDPVCYIKGQQELGSERGYLHWQVLVVFSRKVRGRRIQSIFGPCHSELTRSEAANEYVWKEDTRVEGSQFERGTLPFNRGRVVDWDRIRTLAIERNWSEIPSDVFVRNYSALRRIAADFGTAPAMERTVFCFIGKTGAGKSKRAWEEAGLDAYPKGPSTKFWDGYTGQKHVVIDEFFGEVGISHVLRWFDRYPCLVEIKGSCVPLRAEKIWITSNIHPREWYPQGNQFHVEALMRRIQVTNFSPFDLI